MKRFVCLLLCLLCLSGCSLLKNDTLTGKWVVEAYVINTEVVEPSQIASRYGKDYEIYNGCWIEFKDDGMFKLKYPNPEQGYDEFEGQYTMKDNLVELSVAGQTEQLKLKEKLLIFEMTDTVVIRLKKSLL